jgi:branched-subunit amino acid aminotransferase/4-amino-4-deoxychorismate lyase
MPSSPVALIETVRIIGGRAPLWHLHLRRLVASCRALGVPFPTEFTVPAGGADRVHRLVVSSRGQQIIEREVGPVHPVSLVTSGVVHSPYPHKTVERGQFAEAAAEAEAKGADDGLMLVADGSVAECPIWTVFWWEGETLCAPPLSLGILPSVARARIAELRPIQERKAGRADLNGRSMFVANAARGIVPVGALDGARIPEASATTLLRQRFWTTA